MNYMTMKQNTHHTTAHLLDLRQGEGGEEEEEGGEVGVTVSVGPRVNDGQGMRVIMAPQCRTTDLTLANSLAAYLRTPIGRINKNTLKKHACVSFNMSPKKAGHECLGEVEIQESRYPDWEQIRMIMQQM